MELYEPNSSLLTVKYYPDNEALLENPPRFTWMPAGDDGLCYSLEISESPSFENGIVRENIPYNFYTFDVPLKPGMYFWRYTSAQAQGMSKTRSFTVPEHLPETPLVSRAKRYEAIDKSHPRLWLNENQRKHFQEQLKTNPSYCGFDEFYANSVKPYLNAEFPHEPPAYPDNKKVLSLWRANYMLCQEALCYIRSFSVAGVIKQDAILIAKAKNALLEIAAWDVNGSTKRSYNDECAFRVAYALAFGYDWLYQYLDDGEKETVKDCLFIRTKEVADHVIVHSRIHYALYDSHAVRSLSSVLTPCCIALLFEKDEAREWLDYTIEYFSALYTPWGGKDGGWAEGPMYWTTGMAFVIDALGLIKNYTGIDFFKRPFFQKTGDFILNCCPVETYRASFCDQSNIGEKAGVKTAFNIRHFSGVTRNGNYSWYFNKAMERCVKNPPDFFNKGWWDLYFDDMVFNHDYGTVEEIIPDNKTTVKWFKDIGWVSLSKSIADFDNHIFMLTKSSPYGSVSHSHGDQNSVLLFAFGEPLIIKSGHYVGFGSSMHLNWRRQTKSHNTLLIDGIGQYAGMDKPKQLSAIGSVIEVSEESNHVYIKEDATQAYAETVPYLKTYTREIYFVDEEYFVIVDTVVLDQDGEINFLLHALHSFNINADDRSIFHIKGEKADLKGKIIYSATGIKEISESDVYDGVDAKETEGLDKQYHYRMDTGKGKRHTIVTLLHPLRRKNQNRYISAIQDDQGHDDVYLYFDNNGSTFTLKLTHTKSK